MQQIERYGVMVLLLMFVTILVVAMWDGEAPAQKGVAKPGADAVASAKPSTRQAPARSSSTRPRQTAPRPRETRSVPIGSVAADRPSSGQQAARGNRTASSSPRSRRASRPEPARTELRTVGSPLPSTGTPASVVGSSAASSTPRMAGGPTTAPAGGERTAPTTPAPERRTSPSINSVASREARPAAPARSTTPASRTSGWTYEIKPGDTLQGIASRVLGDGARWKEIQAVNAGLDPRRLMVGARIQLPGGADRVASQGAPTVTSNVRPAVARPATRPATGGATYVIRKGDVLSRVAQDQLGSASRWREIVELNPGLDPNRLHVGTKLVLPGGARPASSTPEPTAVAVADTRSAAADDRRFRVR